MAPPTTAAELSRVLPHDIARLNRQLKSPVNLESFIVHLGMLEELDTSNEESQDRPEVIGRCLGLCNSCLDEIAKMTQEYINRNGGPSSALLQIEEKITYFNHHVQLLKDLTNNSLTHKFLEEIQGIQLQQNMQQKRSVDQMLDYMKKFMKTSAHDKRYPQRAEHFDANALVPTSSNKTWNEPQQHLQTMELAVRHDPYAFTAKIIHDHDGGSSGAEVRAMLDTGCSDNWVSLDVVRRTGLEEQMDEIEDPWQYAGFGGGTLTPIGKINITWCGPNSAMSRRTSFLVHENVPFDLVIGKYFLNAENILIFNEPALALRHANLTKEELNAMEGQVEQTELKNQSLSAIRKAKHAAARQRQREEKLARSQYGESQYRFNPQMRGSPPLNGQASIPTSSQSGSLMNFPVTLPRSALQPISSRTTSADSTSLVLYGSNNNSQEEQQEPQPDIYSHDEREVPPDEIA